MHRGHFSSGFVHNKKKSWLKFILISVFCIGNILRFLENLMLFSYFNSMCISMYVFAFPNFEKDVFKGEM